MTANLKTISLLLFALTLSVYLKAQSPIRMYYPRLVPGDKEITVSFPSVWEYKSYVVLYDTSTLIPNKSPFVRYYGNDTLIKVKLTNLHNGKLYNIAVSGLLDNNTMGPLGRAAIGAASKPAFLTVLNHDNTISSFSVDVNSGSLTTTPGQPYSTGLQWASSIALSPMMNAAYLVSPFQSSFSAFDYNASQNTFKPRLGYPMGAGQNAAYVTRSADGKNVYIADSGGQQVSAFATDDSYGNIDIIANYHSGNIPTFIANHPSGKFIYVINSGDSTITVFKRDTLTGALTALGQAAGVGKNPTSMAISHSGLWAYVTNNESNSISVLHIDQSTGGFDEKASYPTGANPQFVAIAPNDSLVLVTNASSNTISAFIRNDKDEKLVQMSGSPFPTGAQPNQLAFVNPFVYVTNNGDNSISEFIWNNWERPSQSTLIKLRTYAKTDGVGTGPTQIIATGASPLLPPTKFAVHMVPRDSLSIVTWKGVLRFNAVPGASSYIVWVGGQDVTPENHLVEIRRGYPVQTRLISANPNFYFRIAAVNEAGVGFVSPAYLMSDFISNKTP